MHFTENLFSGGLLAASKSTIITGPCSTAVCLIHSLGTSPCTSPASSEEDVSDGAPRTPSHAGGDMVALGRSGPLAAGAAPSTGRHPSPAAHSPGRGRGRGLGAARDGALLRLRLEVGVQRPLKEKRHAAGLERVSRGPTPTGPGEPTSISQAFSARWRRATAASQLATVLNSAHSSSCCFAAGSPSSSPASGAVSPLSVGSIATALRRRPAALCRRPSTRCSRSNCPAGERGRPSEGDGRGCAAEESGVGGGGGGGGCIKQRACARPQSVCASAGGGAVAVVRAPRTARARPSTSAFCAFACSWASRLLRGVGKPADGPR